MKKPILFLFLLLAPLLLTACQSIQPDMPLWEAARQALNKPDAFIPYTAEDLYDLTGISPDDYAEAVFLRDADTLSGRELIMVQAKDANGVRSIQKALEQYLSQRKEETRNYLPEAYRLYSDAKARVSGLTVSLIVQ